MRSRLLALLWIAASLGNDSIVWGQEARAMSEGEIHDLIVQHFSALSSRELPAGDTFVSWTTSPILFHTLQRDSNLVTTGMVRNDGMVGTETVAWADSQIASASILWTMGDSVLVDMTIEIDGDSIVFHGTTEGAYSRPALPWAIADYGMEDQVIPLLKMLPQGQESLITVFRPFAAKWDTLQIAGEPLADGRLYSILDEEGNRDSWLVGRSGHLLEMGREGQEFTRLPLPGSSLMAKYRKLEESVVP